MPLPELGPLPDPRAARPVVGEIEGLRDDLWSRGVAKVLLAGAGGVGVAAEALAGPGARLTVLDGTDPVQLDEALAGDLDATVLVVSVPPGTGTAGVEIIWDAVAAGFAESGLDPAAHTVLVAPPDSPLISRAGGAPVVPGPGSPDVAGLAVTSQAPRTLRRDSAACDVGAWAALTPYALVPAGLAGGDVGAVLSAALDAPGDDELADRLRGTSGHVALAGPLAESLAQLVTVLDRHRPLVVEEAGAPGWGDAVLTVGGPKADIPADAPPGAELLRWQGAVASLVDRPGLPPGRTPPAPTPGGDGPVAPVTFGAVEVRTRRPVATLRDALAGLVHGIGSGSLAVHAHLDRHDDASAALLRTELTARTGLVTAFGWGARTAPLADAVVQVTGAGPAGPAADHQLAEAAAEAAALERAGIRVLRLHLTDRLAGLVELVRAVQDLGPARGSTHSPARRPADLT